MRTYKQIEKIVKTNELESTKCDFCDKEIEKRPGRDEEKEVREVFKLDDYGNGSITHIDVEMRYSQGYPESSDAYTWSIDICPTCFKVNILDKAKRFNLEETNY